MNESILSYLNSWPFCDHWHKNVRFYCHLRTFAIAVIISLATPVENHSIEPFHWNTTFNSKITFVETDFCSLRMSLIFSYKNTMTYLCTVSLKLTTQDEAQKIKHNWPTKIKIAMDTLAGDCWYSITTTLGAQRYINNTNSTVAAVRDAHIKTKTDVPFVPTMYCTRAHKATLLGNTVIVDILFVCCKIAHIAHQSEIHYVKLVQQSARLVCSSQCKL